MQATQALATVHIADFTDSENGVRSHVDQTAAGRFIVRLQDVDSGEFIPDHRAYGAEGDAMAYARKLVGLPMDGGALTSAERTTLVSAASGRGCCFTHELEAMTDSDLVFAAFPFMGNSTASAWYRDMQARGLAPAPASAHCKNCGSTRPNNEILASLRAGSRSACCRVAINDGPLAAVADPEYQTRIDAARVTLQFGAKSNKRFDAGKAPITDSPLFGGPAQGGLF